MNPRLCHDTAWACTVSILQCIEGVFREEERKDAAAAEIYGRIKAAIEAYDIHNRRERHRLDPSRN